MDWKHESSTRLQTGFDVLQKPFSATWHGPGSDALLVALPTVFLLDASKSPFLESKIGLLLGITAENRIG